jgi:hypothetical protein
MSAHASADRRRRADRRARTIALAAGLVAALGGATAPAAVAEPVWRLEQPAAPPPPGGAAPAPFPVPLGPIGDIAFARPNRGALITAGNGPVEAGLYAYDGVAWHQLATVCGGSDGRLAWAGPGELWTVSDQRPGQRSTIALRFDDRSLCRIAGGRVVASYATPQGRPDSYQAMDAAACRGLGDCWFGGELLASPPPFGAFHLRWDGTSVIPVPSAAAPVNDDPAHAVADIAAHQGGYVESVVIDADDPQNPAAPDVEDAPVWLHFLGSDLAAPFQPLPLPIALGRTPSGAPVRPTDLAGFRLASDGDTLWAVAGATGSGRANVVIVRLLPSGEVEQLDLGPDSPFPPGTRVADVAAEPGTGAVWIAYGSDSATAPAEVARIGADGTVSRVDTVPAPGDPVGPKGSAAKLACAAPDDCWLATSRGWLFHLTDGSAVERDADPAFAGVITFRPPDGGVPFQPPIDPPVDDSLTNQVTPPGGSVEQPDEPGARRRRRAAKPLVTGVRSFLPRGSTVLRVSFRLSARARVRVVARRRGKLVARTRYRRLGRGRHSVRLRLDPRRWPTRLAVDARAVKGGGSASTSALRAPVRGGAR